MTNPTAAMRLLITYAVCIPVAIIVGYLLTNPLDYGTLGFLGLLLAVLVSPIFIRWHYPLLVFGLASPIICFFIVGKPPLSQVIVVVSLGIAVAERIINAERKFISESAITWPLLYLCAMVFMTAELNDGIQLQHMGGGGAGGGRKYLDIFIGIATFFALTSQAIPRERRKFYLMLYMLPGLLGLVSDLFAYLPSPLNEINLLFPPTAYYNAEEGVTIGKTRLFAVAGAMGTVMFYMLARYGLRGIFSAQRPWRAGIFALAFLMSLLGGFRSSLGGLGATMLLMFFLEGMQRSRLVPVLLVAGVLAGTLLTAFSDKLPFTFQRSMSFLPLKWDPEVLVDAEGSSEWRYAIWRATWPKVPEHLLLGKGYNISAEDYEMTGQGTFSRIKSSHIDAGDDALTFSSDYHSGPLSTLMPFGLWGGIGILWLMGACIYVTYHNYRYGDPELTTMNAFFFANSLTSPIFFMFVVGAFTQSVAGIASAVGFSIAMNGGMARPQPKPVVNPVIKSRAVRAPQPA
jgi:hypothetical protein